MDQFNNYEMDSPSTYQSTPYANKTFQTSHQSAPFYYNTGYNPYMAQIYPWTPSDYNNDQSVSSTTENSYTYVSPRSLSQSFSSSVYSSNVSACSPPHENFKMTNNLKLFEAHSSPIYYQSFNQNNFIKHHHNSEYIPNNVSIDFSKMSSEHSDVSQTGVSNFVEINHNINDNLLVTSKLSNKKLVSSNITPKMMTEEGN